MSSQRPSLPKKPAKGYAPRSVHLPEYQVVVDLLRDIRVGAGMTQTDLAHVLGRTQTYVSAVERGITRTDPLQLRSWLLACGSSLEAFGRRLEKQLAKSGK